MELYCGIEGGGTSTTCLILDSSCKVLGRSSGGCGNPYLIGMQQACDLYFRLSMEALAAAGLPVPAAGSAPSPPTFAAFGVCASGFVDAAPRPVMEGLLRATYPGLAQAYYIDNDSPGSIYTAAGGSGGCVLIAGTGSMGELMLPSGVSLTCGGNGHMYGDEGSAYSIAAGAIRAIFHGLDGFDPLPASFYDASALPGDARYPPQDTRAAQAAMLRYFELPTPSGMLDVMYGQGFKKDRVAGFAVELSTLAAGGDAFSLGVVARAGRELGAHLRTLTQRAVAGGATLATPLLIVCVGSVWKSWELLKAAFLRAALGAGSPLSAFRLVRLTESSAVGAAWQAGVRAGRTDLPLNSAQFLEVLYDHSG